jgi:molybdenum cofactor biosynthesis enzyme MoaA
VTTRAGNPHAPPATPEHVARLLAEASSVTTTHAAGQVELQLGHFCNNRCVFCASGQLTEEGHAAPVPSPAVDRALTTAAASGLRRVVFLGGEPTIQDSFLPSLARARQLGFEEITVFTNGARTWDLRFLNAVLAGGPLRWRISIQGGDEASHDTIVGKSGAFARILRGLKLLQARRQDVTVNLCLTTAALPSLPLLADLVLDHGVRQLCIDMVRPVSAGERSEAWLQTIMPRFSAMVAPLQALLARLDERAPGFDVNLTHLPFCVLPTEAHRIHHGGEATVTFTADLDERQGAMDKYAFQADDRGKLPSCTGCVFAHRCTGVPHLYARWHGGDELRPVTERDLSERDLRQSAFTDGLRSRLARLSGVEAVADPHQRRVELRLADRGRLWLLPRATPPDPGLWPLAEGPDWRLAVAARALTPRLRQAAGRVAQALASDFEALPFDDARLRRGLAWLARLARRWQVELLRSEAAATGSAPPRGGPPSTGAASVRHVRSTERGLEATVRWQGVEVGLALTPSPEGPLLHTQLVGEPALTSADRSALSVWLGAALRAVATR